MQWENAFTRCQSQSKWCTHFDAIRMIRTHLASLLHTSRSTQYSIKINASVSSTIIHEIYLCFFSYEKPVEEGRESNTEGEGEAKAGDDAKQTEGREEAKTEDEQAKPEGVEDDKPEGGNEAKAEDAKSEGGEAKTEEGENKAVNVEGEGEKEKEEKEEAPAEG